MGVTGIDIHYAAPSFFKRYFTVHLSPGCNFSVSTLRTTNPTSVPPTLHARSIHSSVFLSFSLRMSAGSGIYETILTDGLDLCKYGRIAGSADTHWFYVNTCRLLKLSKIDFSLIQRLLYSAPLIRNSAPLDTYLASSYLWVWRWRFSTMQPPQVLRGTFVGRVRKGLKQGRNFGPHSPSFTSLRTCKQCNASGTGLRKIQQYFFIVKLLLETYRVSYTKDWLQCNLWCAEASIVTVEWHFHAASSNNCADRTRPSLVGLGFRAEHESSIGAV